MRTYIVEDSKLVRDRLLVLLEDMGGLEVVGMSGSVKAAMESIFRLQPDALLVDMKLPDGSALDILKRIRLCRLKIATIVITMDPYPEHRKLAMEHGAIYFFDKAKELWKIPGALEQIIAARHSPPAKPDPSA